MASNISKLKVLADIHPFAARQICGDGDPGEMSDREIGHALAEFQRRGLLGNTSGKMSARIANRLSRGSSIRTAADLEDHADEIRANFGTKFASKPA